MNTRTRHLDPIFFNEAAEPVYLARRPKPVVQDRQDAPDVNNDHCNAFIPSHHQMTKTRLGPRKTVLTSMKVCSDSVSLFTCRDLTFYEIPRWLKMGSAQWTYLSTLLISPRTLHNKPLMIYHLAWRQYSIPIQCRKWICHRHNLKALHR